MLAFRRIIEFSSRVHTYLLAMYSFFAILFVLCLYFPVNEDLVSFITTIQMVIGWSLFLEAFWIVMASILCTISSKVFVIKPVVLTFMRLAVYFATSIIIDLLNTIIINGIRIGG